MDLLIAAGVPSAITAFCFWLIERKIQARAEAEKEERLNRQREQDAKEEKPWTELLHCQKLQQKICRESRTPSATETCTKPWIMSRKRNTIWKIS